MKRWFTLIIGYTIVFGLACWQVNHRHRTAPVKADGVTNGKALYDNYNAWWFKSTLPRGVTVEWDDNDPKEMADTTGTWTEATGIHLNKAYIKTGRTEQMIVFHEMCHIENWVLASQVMKNGGDPHTPEWNACMHRLANEKAFEGLW